MLRISLPYLYQIAEGLEEVAKIQAGSNRNAVHLSLYIAENTVNTLLNSSVFAPYLRSSRDNGQSLLGALRAVLSDPTDRTLSLPEVFPITYQLGQFKTALLAEIGVFPSFFVTQKGSFDTAILLERGDMLFPDDLHHKAPEAVFDITEAAKAIAFELPTAVGFHVFRAVESALRRYYTEMCSGAATPKMRTIKVYVRQMRAKKCGDEAVLASLEQMADLHRNPIAHPEAALTMEEAIATVGIARSAVTAMLKALPVIPPTTMSP